MESTKYQKLVINLARELGIDSNLIDFKRDFINTTWRCIHGHSWESTIKHPSKQLPDLKDLPPIRDMCYCGTNIHWNHLIQHKTTNKYFTIGNVCIRHLGADMRKMCIDCGQFNRKHTSRCGACRVECQIHKEYHDDNRSCIDLPKLVVDNSDSEDMLPYFLQNMSEPIKNEITLIDVFDPMKDLIRFGKHRGCSYQWIKDNDLQYLKWVARTIEDKAWLANHI